MYEELKDEILHSHDRAEKQAENRRSLTFYNKAELKTRPELANRKHAIEDPELLTLMEHWRRYFDPGYFVPMTPEELQAAIVARIDAINEGV